MNEKKKEKKGRNTEIMKKRMKERKKEQRNKETQKQKTKKQTKRKDRDTEKKKNRALQLGPNDQTFCPFLNSLVSLYAVNKQPFAFKIQ